MNIELTNYNIVHITFDALRYDSAVKALTLFLDKVGKLHKGITLSPYTPGAHTTHWTGHFPSDPTTDKPFYNETVFQPFRITTGPSRDAGKGCGILFEGSNIIEGFRRMGWATLGFGGVSQFSSGSFLRTAFPWTNFTYFGKDMDEEPWEPRKSKHFPLNHVDEITLQANQHKNWYLFINSPEPHYPYDWGEGIPKDILDLAPILKRAVNLRSHNLPKEKQKILKSNAKKLHQMQIDGMSALDKKLEALFTSLTKVSTKPIFVFAHADHGENFGELDEETGNLLWGHMHPSKECLEVPMWIGAID